MTDQWKSVKDRHQAEGRRLKSELQQEWGQVTEKASLWGKRLAIALAVGYVVSKVVRSLAKDDEPQAATAQPQPVAVPTDQQLARAEPSGTSRLFRAVMEHIGLFLAEVAREKLMEALENVMEDEAADDPASRTEG